MKTVYLFLFVALCCFSCQDDLAETNAVGQTEEMKKADHKLFHATLRQHLNATFTKDIDALESLMSPDGVMYTMRPNTPVIHSTASYIEFHRSWFQDDSWKLSGQITDSYVGTDVGTAIVDMRYEVPNLNGKSVWNEMVVSYVLKKVDDKWYVISDHSSSKRKSPSLK